MIVLKHDYFKLVSRYFEFEKSQKLLPDEITQLFVIGPPIREFEEVVSYQIVVLKIDYYKKKFFPVVSPPN